MKKFLLGLLAGLLLAGLAGFIVVFALMRAGERRPNIPSDGTLVLRLEGDVPERPPMEIPLPFFESQTPLTLFEVRDLLRKAAADSRIKAVVFEPRSVAAGWGKLHEIRHSLVEYKKSGKPLIANLSWPRSREYYLATAADRIYMSREDLLDLKGLRAELLFFRKTLDKVGVEFEIEHAGRYKDAADSFTRTAPTPETLEVMNAILDGIYGNMLDSIAASRKMTRDQVKALLDEGPFIARDAKAKGLVDDLLFDDQVYDELKGKLKQSEIKKVGARDYNRVSATGLGLDGNTRIAVVVGEGAITRGGGGDGLEDEGIRSASFIRLLRSVRDDNSIRAVIVRVNSPGGDGVASDEILREVRLLSKKKPTVISMSDLAASGGYFISMTGDPIVAYPNTLTGSIGVIYGKANLAGLYEKLGITYEVMMRGKNADIDSEIVRLDEDGRKKLREALESMYTAFIERVAEGRNKKPDAIRPLAEGRVWLGSQAKANGLIDENGGLDKAIELVRGKAKIAASEKIRLVMYPRKKTVFEQLFGGDASRIESPLARVARTLNLPLSELRLWVPGGYMRLMPYTIRIQ
jgi:protease-4